MLCAFIVMKCEGFDYITDLMDYLDNNRSIAHYCSFNSMKPLPSYWTYDRFLRERNNDDLKDLMASLVRQLYELGVAVPDLFQIRLFLAQASPALGLLLSSAWTLSESLSLYARLISCRCRFAHHNYVLWISGKKSQESP